MSDDLFPREPVTLEQQIACVERELHMRERVYPHWIASKKMSEEKAAHEIRAMDSVLETLRGMKK